MQKKIVFLVVIVFIGVFYISQNFDNDELESEKSTPALMSEKKYVCPMHAHIISHEADNCPVCGMDLVLSKSTTTEDITNESEEYPVVKISPNIVHNLGVRTAIVERGDLTHTIETIGKITRVDPMARSRVTSPISGTIIKMVDKYGGDSVKQDEFLFSVASEEFFNMQKTFQVAFQSGDKATASAMIPKLVSMGLDAEQVAKLQKGAKPVFPAKIYAKEDGYVFTRRGQQGEKITSSYTVFNLGGNYQVIEVTVEIFERQWDLVKEGQAASMRLRNLPGKIFRGTVERVDEPVGYTTRALETRLKFKTNYKGLTQSTFARVIIDGKTKHNVLTVPRDAVIRTEKGSRVIHVEDDGQYRPVSVVIGEESNGKVEIVSGIDPGCEVVVSGQFLIDSESNLLSELRRMSSITKPVAKTQSSKVK